MCSRFTEAAAFASCLFLLACQQQDRTATKGQLVRGNPMTPFQPGKPAPLPSAVNPVEPTEDVIGEGKQLFNQFNCSGCHANGGGAIGPPLMDDEWIYGSSAGIIFWTIIEGRPQGMPAFGGRIAEHQAWRIVAYVRSLSGLHKRDSDYAGQVQTLPSKAVSRTEAPLARRGQEVFLNGPCAMCHTIRGTLAGGRTGPDLTHVASRRMLAAGTLANTPGYLVRWIVNPQNLKPGTKMPPTRLPTADLHALVAFLGSLK